MKAKPSTSFWRDRARIWALAVTGALVLALEVLASRILTPYFGVSLYIWAGILSITLLCLALGYLFGGRLAARLERRRLEAAYAALPALAAWAVIVAAGIYPFVFPSLARFDLVTGSFAAALVLLTVPLVLLSALNPMLVALRRKPDPAKGAGDDAGAGQVFFLSTLGSVAGVLLTAFLVIPNLSNFESLLWGAALLGAISLALAFGLTRTDRLRPKVLLVGALALLAGCLLAAFDVYGRLSRGPWAWDGQRWQVVDEKPSLFGTIKVVDGHAKDGRRTFRLLYHDGISQNEIDERGRSLAEYTYALERLSLMWRPEAKSALVLGLGAGIVPGRLAARGLKVEAVEINPRTVEIAERYFGFSPKEVKAHLDDARTFVKNCKTRYDMVVMDLFFGDATPDYLLTRQFFADVKGCLSSDGVLAINSFRSRREDTGRPLLVTLAAAFSQVVYYENNSELANSYIIAADGAGPLRDKIDTADMPPFLAMSLGAKATRGRSFQSGLADKDLVIDDQRNTYAARYARAHLALRRNFLEQFPPLLFLN